MVQGRWHHIASYLRDFLFRPEQFRTPLRVLSGGERNRLLLARAARPALRNLMVLDEPTNDLDMDTLDLLQELLGEFAGTLLLVSHDRDFLDRLVGGVIAFEGGSRSGSMPAAIATIGASARYPWTPAGSISESGGTALRCRDRTARGTRAGKGPQRELARLLARIDTLQAQIRCARAAPVRSGPVPPRCRGIHDRERRAERRCRPSSRPPSSAGWSWRSRSRARPESQRANLREQGWRRSSGRPKMTNISSSRKRFVMSCDLDPRRDATHRETRLLRLGLPAAPRRGEF